jgi:hypothetical protein
VGSAVEFAVDYAAGVAGGFVEAPSAKMELRRDGANGG